MKDRRWPRRDILRLGGAVAVSTGASLVAAGARSSRGRAALPGGGAEEHDLDGRPNTLVLPGLHADGPLPDAFVSSGSVYQGGTVRVAVPGAVSATVTLFDQAVEMDHSGAELVAYLGIGVNAIPGTTTLAVDAHDPVVGPVHIERPIAILPTEWTVDYIVLPPGTGGGSEDPDYPRRVQEEIELLAATYARVTERRWSEPWFLPVMAPVSGYFGEQRSFNGGPVGGHHGGTDFGAEAGTPVGCTNAGVVVVARELAVRGNAVIVDHGSGILSCYAHLSSIAVAENQPVAKGQAVGQVGTTGLSTGPHLHWEMSVRGILVDGLRWTNGSQGF